MKITKMTRKEFRRYLRERKITTNELFIILKDTAWETVTSFSITQLTNYLYYRTINKWDQSDIERLIRKVYKVDIRPITSQRKNIDGITIETVESPDVLTYMICASCGTRHDNVPVSPVRLINCVVAGKNIEQEICASCADSKLYNYKYKVLSDDDAYEWRKRFRNSSGFEHKWINKNKN